MCVCGENSDVVIKCVHKKKGIKVAIVINKISRLIDYSRRECDLI